MHLSYTPLAALCAWWTPTPLTLVALLGVLALGGFVGAWLYMIRWGMGVAGLRRPIYWGTYIASFVFWVGISHSGTFVSAILRVFKAEFRRPFTRAAEMMTSASLLVTGFPWMTLRTASSTFFMLMV